MSFKGRRIVLTGGGTGGHITPLVAVGRVLHGQGAELLWIGDASHGQSAELAARQLKIHYADILAGKWHRFLTFENIKTPFRLIASIIVARRLLKQFRAELVFSKGGYVSLPVVIAAWLLQIPIVCHESDAVMGWANQIAARLANKVCVSFKDIIYPSVDRNKMIVTGLPIREVFTKTRLHKQSKRQILITGGSQGAVSLNEMIFAILPELTQAAEVIHLTGPTSYAKAIRHKSKQYHPFESVDENQMAYLMAGAALIISRASATTMVELATLGRPAILVPLPRSANGHQQANARYFYEAGAASILMPNEQCSERLLAKINDLIDHQGKREKLAHRVAKLSLPGATENIIWVIELVLETSHPEKAPKESNEN